MALPENARTSLISGVENLLEYLNSPKDHSREVISGQLRLMLERLQRAEAKLTKITLANS